jgi:hypothetical protein
VPLLEPDPDAPIYLNQIVQNIYDRASYDLLVDYSQPPRWPELFKPEDKAWIENLLQITIEQ